MIELKYSTQVAGFTFHACPTRLYQRFFWADLFDHLANGSIGTENPI